jgi:small subunit ribosomal protein S6
MQHYELLYIITEKKTEEELEPVNQVIFELIEKNQGKITLKEDLSKKKLAYQIKHNYHGYYQLIEFDLEPDKLAEIERKIKLTGEILRHQVVKKKIKTPEQIARERVLMNKLAEKREEIREEKREDKKEPVREKIKLEDLDKKLDELLDGEDII